MMGIRAAIAIAEEPAVDEPVVVGTILVLDGRRGVDGQRHFRQDGWLEDPRRPNQGDSGALEVEAAFEDGARNGGFAKASPLFGQEVKGA